ncbi:unnamed protein product, partial [Ectocarpus sp. 13 AM-2016]
SAATETPVPACRVKRLRMILARAHPHPHPHAHRGGVRVCKKAHRAGLQVSFEDCRDSEGQHGYSGIPRTCSFKSRASLSLGVPGGICLPRKVVFERPDMLQVSYAKPIDNKARHHSRRIQ